MAFQSAGWPLAPKSSSALCQVLLLVLQGVAATLLTNMASGGAGLVADHSTMRQVVLGYMVPVAATG